jgi:hypothetical protein
MGAPRLHITGFVLSCQHSVHVPVELSLTRLLVSVLQPGTGFGLHTGHQWHDQTSCASKGRAGSGKAKLQ